MNVPEAHGDYVGWVIGVIAILVAVYAIFDVRRVKSRLEILIGEQDAMLKQIRGFLLGVKPSVSAEVQHQINDQLEYLKKLEASTKSAG